MNPDEPHGRCDAFAAHGDGYGACDQPLTPRGKCPNRAGHAVAPNHAWTVVGRPALPRWTSITGPHGGTPICWRRRLPDGSWLSVRYAGPGSWLWEHRGPGAHSPLHKSGLAGSKAGARQAADRYTAAVCPGGADLYPSPDDDRSAVVAGAANHRAPADRSPQPTHPRSAS